MKRSSGDKQLGLASPLQSAASQSGRTNHPCENERAGCKSPHPHLSEGRGEVFFLDILFHRMSVMAIFHQLRGSFRLADNTAPPPKKTTLCRKPLEGTWASPSAATTRSRPSRRAGY